MSIKVYTGLPGNGKSYAMCADMNETFEYNIKMYIKHGIKRVIYTNQKLSDNYLEKVYYFNLKENNNLDWEIIYLNIEKNKKNKRYSHFIKYKDFYKYWKDFDEVLKERDIDLYIDEIHTFFDANEWVNTPKHYRDWFRKHEHYGVKIYGTTQDITTIDKSIRRLITDCYWVNKIIGSPRPTTFAKPKNPWAIFWKRNIDFKDLNTDAMEVKPKFSIDFYLLNAIIINMYDTLEDLIMEKKEKKIVYHIDEFCETCNKIIKVSHK